MMILKENSEFQYVLKHGKWYGSELLMLYICEKEQNFNRVGVAVGKKAGKSVIRNYLKRLIREAYRVNDLDLVSGYDIVIVWRSSAKTNVVDFHIVEKNLLKCFKKADLLKIED